MKKIVLLFTLLGAFTFYGQNKTDLKQKKQRPKKEMRAVMSEVTSASTKFNISGSTTPVNLDEIIKTAKDFGVEIKFSNEKYVRNQLEFIELNYFTNNKWETLNFGSDELKLLPVRFSLVKKYDKMNGDKSFLIIDKNANDKLHEAPREIVIL